MFQNSVINKYLKNLEQKNFSEKFLYVEKYKSKREEIFKLKEEEYQDGFLRDIFVNILEYTLRPDKDFNLVREKKKDTDGKKADGAIIDNNGNVIAIIELKSTKKKNLGDVETQAFGYKNNFPTCHLVIISNFEKLRLYIDHSNEYEEFNLFEMSENRFKEFYLMLAKDNVMANIPLKLKEESKLHEENITKQLYKDYSTFKNKVFNNLVNNNKDLDKLILFKKSQKLFDRFLFILFGEDKGLLPPNLITIQVDKYKQLKKLDAYFPLYDLFKKLFNYLDKGHKDEIYYIPAYNGGLFEYDNILDNPDTVIDDDVLIDDLLKLSNYDFDTEVDVNILGHIFEHSLSEIEEITSELLGVNVDKSKSKRKKDGIFYTPKYITKYIVENTVGKLCIEKKMELGILDIDEELLSKSLTKKGRLTAKANDLYLKLEEYRKFLLDLKICDPACGSGAFLNQVLEFLINEHNNLDNLIKQLFNKMTGGISIIKSSILEKNLYGVDINEESVEIAKLSLWLRTAEKGRKLSKLSNHIKVGNSLIDDVEIAGDKAFNWKKEFPDVFEKGGFDVVIGNPPYVQLQKMKEISAQMKQLNYKTYESTGDLYCLFYELGINLLNKKGFLGFITSNKWMRANYGRNLRNFFYTQTDPYLLLNLGEGIFEGAVVDSNILFLKKGKAKKNTIPSLDISHKPNVQDFSIYYNQFVEICPQNDDIWAISSIEEQNIKTKIEKLGTPLKDWDIEINRGILTGLTNAFIISKEKRDEIVRKDPKSIEIIKPVLRGRDIKRYTIDYQDLYIINTHNGYGNIERINVDNYPAIKEHLLQYEPKLSKRYDKGETPFNLRNCAYLEDFNKTNIFYPDISQKLSFVLSDKGYYTTNTGYFICSDNKYILCILNSKLINFYYKSISAQLGKTGIRAFTIYVKKIPVIKNTDESMFVKFADTMQYLTSNFQNILIQFSKFLKTKLSIIKLNNKLQNWYKLEPGEFLKELNSTIKKSGKPKLTKLNEMEWMELFENMKAKIQTLKAEISNIDKEIDQMVYKLYDLTEGEIKIVEESEKRCTIL